MPNPSIPSKGLAIWGLIIVISILIYFLLQPHVTNPEKEIDYSTFHQAMIRKEIRSVQISGQEIRGEDRSDRTFRTIAPPNTGYDLVKDLEANGVTVKIIQESPSFWFYLGNYLPFLIIPLVFWFMFNKMPNPISSRNDFIQGRAKRFEGRGQKITFKEVAGVEEAKEELQETVDFLKNPGKFQRLGGRMPKGILLIGPTGTGKTLLARATAGEAGVPFFSISGSGFVEMYVGVGASRVRDLFEQGKKNVPCIIFLDEIDALGRQRGTGIGGSHDEREQTLNQLLVEMDGFENNTGVMVIAATNRPDVLDPALLRPGRFDRQVVVPLPDLKGREEILRVHASNKPLTEEVDLAQIARGTPGFSGAALANLLNEAALQGAKFNASTITLEHLEYARDKVTLGKPRRLVITAEEKVTTAFHEAGHAVTAFFVPLADPLHKITIIPHGLALGLTSQLPREDRFNLTRVQAETQVTICLGGRAAEKLFLNTETAGCANDLEQATELATKMAKRWGMSAELGLRTFGEDQNQPFLGIGLTRNRDHSEKSAQAIDEAIQQILHTGYTEAETILKNNREKLQALVAKLLEKETLDAKEIEFILGPRPTA